MIRLALFISGGGTTACAIIKACRNNHNKITPVLVIASKKNIPGISRIRDLGFPKEQIFIVDPKNFKNSDSFAERLLFLCRKFNVNLIGQYGWLPLTPKKLIANYRNKIINQHPGPLDVTGIDFGGKGMYGRRVHAAVLYFRRATNHDYWTEATSHYVTDIFDRGAVIKSKKIKIQKGDTVDELQKRVLGVEHEVQLAVLKDFVIGKVKEKLRKTPLIKNSEMEYLNKAKEAAIYLYPHG